MKKLLGGAGAALGVKLLTGIAIAAAAAVVAGAATEVAITGSVNPANWGQQVTQQVSGCKASAARLGVHGIGECVSDFASSKARTNQGKDNGKDNSKNGKNNSNSKSNGKGNNGNGNGNGHKPAGAGNPGADQETSMLLIA